jgi:hypothetical protein
MSNKTPRKGSATTWEDVGDDSEALLSQTSSGGQDLAEYGQAGGRPRRAGGEKQCVVPRAVSPAAIHHRLCPCRAPAHVHVCAAPNRSLTACLAITCSSC